MKLYSIAIRNIKRNKKRSLLSIIATAIATFSMVFMFAYVEGIMVDMQNLAFNYDSGEVQIRNRDFDDKIFSLDIAVDNYVDVLDMLEKEFDGLELSPRLRFPSQVIAGNRTYTCFGVAVDFDREVDYLDLEEKLLVGQLPKGPREVLIGVGLAEELEVGVGDKFTPITLTRRGASSGITFRITGIAKFEQAAFTNKTFLASLEQVPTMLKMKGAVSEILIKGSGAEGWDELKSQVNQKLEQYGFSQLESLAWTEIGMGYTMMEIGDISYDIMAIFFFALASTVIANTMMMVVFERRKEIGTITAMGMTSREVVRLFFLEAFMLGVLGAALGVLMGALLVIPLSIYGMDLSEMGSTVDFGISWYIYPKLNMNSTLVVFLYSVFVASFISFFPSRSAAKVDPVVALRSE